MESNSRYGMSKTAAGALVLIALIATIGSVAIANNAISVQAQNSSTTTTTSMTDSYSTPSCSSTTGSTTITLVAERAQVQIANNVTYVAWTFNGTVPAPTIWVTQCEDVQFTLINNDSMAHSIDFHAAQVNWATVYAPVAPGQSLSFSFVPSYPGIFMYHCGVPPVLEHIANGMYGIIVVNGTGNYALPPAPGGQHVIIESEFYLNSHPNADGSYSGNYTKMLTATPDYVVFNGKAFQYQANPMVVKPNQLVRLYVFNEGPNIWEAFHVIGGIMDTVYIDGNPVNVLHGQQTVNIPPAGGAIIDMYFPDAGGLNPFVNHAFAYAQKGAIGVFKVENTTTTTTTSSSAVSGSKVSIEPGSAANTTSTYYSPSTITVLIGMNNTVTWINNDNAPHTVTDQGVFDSGNLNAGQSWTHTFTTPGTYNYFCTYHPWMKGTIIVKSAP